MLQSIQMRCGWARLNLADLWLAQAKPLTEQGLGDTVWSVDRVVMRVGAVGPKHPPEVLSGEGLSELFGLLGLVRDLGRDDELVA